MILLSRLRQFARHLRNLGSKGAKRSPMPTGICRFIDRVKLKYNVRAILDIGANHGRTAAFFAHSFPSAAIHAFEPLPGCQVYLEQLARAHPQVTVHAMAIGDQSLQMEMFANVYDQAS